MNVIELKRPFGDSSLSVDGTKVPLSESLKLRNHSPTGFAWGYGGSGPSQTALAILQRVVGDELAQRHYMSFKFEKVAAWPQNENVHAEVDVAEWVRQREATRPHDCNEHAVPVTTDGPLGHGWECGICGKFLQAG